MAGGRHSSPDSGRSIGFYAVGGLVAVAVVATGVVVFKATQSDSCESVDEYSLAADPAIAPAVTEILAESSPEQTRLFADHGHLCAARGRCGNPG